MQLRTCQDSEDLSPHHHQPPRAPAHLTVIMATASADLATCDHCGSGSTNPGGGKCAQCGRTQYCSRACQKAAWRTTGDVVGHKYTCTCGSPPPLSIFSASPGLRLVVGYCMVLAKLKNKLVPIALHNPTRTDGFDGHLADRLLTDITLTRYLQAVDACACYHLLEIVRTSTLRVSLR